MNKKQFENMSLYTLASLYIDTYQDYTGRTIHETDRKLNTAILNYVINDRHDESYFFPLVERVLKIRGEN